MSASFDSVLAGPGPVLALAPMQDVTDLAFWRLLSGYGGADLYFTEYFRVYPGSTLDRTVLRSVTEPIDTSTPMGRTIFAVLAGMAEQEREAITERTWHGRREKDQAENARREPGKIC